VLRLLFVWSATCKDSAYISISLRTIAPSKMEVTRVFLNDYPEFNDRGYDYLIYNTFADEGHPHKFDREVTQRADEKFHQFRGPKLLLDSHDDGTVDGFARMNDKLSPRIKYTPGYEFVKDYNVIAAVPIKIRWFHKYQGEEKTIPIIYTGVKEPFPHTIRREVANRLIPFGVYTTRHRSSQMAASLLRQAKISIGVPGWGPIGSAHCEALAAKAVLFSHDWVKKVKLLPFAELEDGYHYVSFNMENLEGRLQWLMKDEERIKFIANNGYKAFQAGYSPRATAEIILKFFMG